MFRRGYGAAVLAIIAASVTAPSSAFNLKSTYFTESIIVVVVVFPCWMEKMIRGRIPFRRRFHVFFSYCEECYFIRRPSLDD